MLFRSGLVCCMIIRALPQTTVFVQTAWECVRYDNLPVLLQRTTFATTTEFWGLSQLELILGLSATARKEACWLSLMLTWYLVA